jgi:hypothetical protein
MRRRLLFFGLLALFPGVVSAQESKLVNCRTLEAAGNFVGPDEVIVDDMVCQKVKAGSDAAAKPQSQKPVIGTVISDAPADSVVGAAKAAEKRVAERRELEAAKNAAVPAVVNAAPATEPAPAAQNASPAVAPAETTEAPSEPSREPRAAAATATTGAAPEPAAAAPTPAVPAVEPAVTPAPEPAPAAMPIAPAQAAKSEVAAPVEPARQLAAPSAAEAKPESAAPLEIVLSSAPANAPAPQSAEPKTEAPAEPTAAPATAPATASAAEPVPAAPASAPRGAPTAAAESREATSPASSTGFYDVNAPKDGARATPPPNTGFATAEQVNSGLAPGASTIPTSGETAASESPEPLHTTIAAARVDFDEDRDRSVKLGDFAKPRDAAPDPSTEHRTSVDASEADGFQDRQRPECTKNITLGGLQGEKLVLGVPSWAAKWIEKNEKRMPQICFSETPMKGARNYLIVFATPGGADNGKDIADAAVHPEKGSSAAGVGTFTTSFGSTWHYAYDRNVGTTVLTEDDADEPYSKPGQLLYATAFTEEGVPVTQRWPGQPKQETKPTEKNAKKLKGEMQALEHVSDELLGQLVEDIEKL